MSISIVVPCYNEQESIPYFYKSFEKLTNSIGGAKRFEVIFVDDGSVDNTLKVVQELSKIDYRIKYISFSRNFGKEAAILAGLTYATSDYVAIMDADLQDPPELLPTMYRYITEDGYDSVATRRVDRIGEPPIRSFFARAFYGIMNMISKTELVDGARDYRLMNRKFVSAILSMKEYNRFSKGLFGWVGYKTKWIEYENVERVAGETKWSFWKLFIYAIDGIVAFSTVPLTLSTVIGTVCCCLSFFSLAFIIIRKMIYGDPIQGWASMISTILFLGGIQLLCIGILGQYLAKTYLETKKRPVYIVNESNIS